MAKKAPLPSAKTNLLLALGAVTVGDKLSPEIMSKVSELHTLLAPPKRERKKRATKTTTGTTSTATSTTTEVKKAGFKVSPGPKAAPAAPAPSANEDF